MKRKDFMQIIKLRSMWKVDGRVGDYKLPDGKLLSTYIKYLVESQMKLDSLGIRANGDLCLCNGGDWNKDTTDFNYYTLMPAFKENETCSREDMERRIDSLVSEIIG